MKAPKLTPFRWWNVPRDQPQIVASTLCGVAASIENWNYGRRYQNLVYARLVTGRELPMMFGMFMNRRVGPITSSYMQAQYQGPQDNVVAEAVETLENRIGKNRPWIVVQPNGGDSNVRRRSKLLQRYIDAWYRSIDIYSYTSACFRDRLTFGTDFLKTYVGLNGKITKERVLCDEILIDEAEAAVGPPKSMIQRRYVFRDDLLAIYGTDPAAAHAIRTAPAAFPGLVYAGTSIMDVIPILEAWKTNRADGEVGRHVLALPNHIFEDEPYDEETFPFAVGRCVAQSFGYWGQGVAEALLPYQYVINRIVDVIDEAQRRFAVPRVLVADGSSVVAKSLANKVGAIVKYAGIKPEFVTPAAMSADVYASKAEWRRLALQRYGLNEQQTSGGKPMGLNSGTALMTQNQIEDARHVKLAQGVEQQLVDDCNITLRLLAELKPTVIVPGSRGERIAWDDVAMDLEDRTIEVFPISSLPTSQPGRQQKIAQWFANGIITKQEQLRLEDVPDTEAFIDYQTATADVIEWTLDKMEETGKYIPPEPFDDLQGALKACQARYNRLRTLNTPEKILRLFRQWMYALEDLAQDPSSLPAVNAAPAVGPQPPALPPGAPGQAPAGPPIQAAPAEAAPAVMQ
jgi:hypothetical protein